MRSTTAALVHLFKNHKRNILEDIKMTEYFISHYDAFSVTAYGKALSKDKNPFELVGEKAQLFTDLHADGRWDKLKSVAKNDWEFSVNEAVDGEFMFYAGVFTDEEVEDATRVINFPAGEYLVIKATGTDSEVWPALDKAAFAEILPQATDFAYVGGPNANVQMAVNDGVITAQKWIPIVRK